MKNLIILAFILIFFTINTNAADLKLPAIFGSNMVMQQKSMAPVWGWAKKGSKVSIKASWLDKTSEVKADNEGKWKVKLATPEAGDPYTLTISADTTIQFENILMGEVWVCSGQSNMEMPVKGFKNQPVSGSNNYIASSANNNIRLFTVKKKISTEPLDDCIGNWSVASPETVANFSATGYSFGRYLQSIINVPVGLISTNWGGTPAEAWTDLETLKNDFKEFDFSILGTDKMNQRSPSVLFNGMISPILTYAIKGAIWYQGEANRARAEQYAELFPAMINNWRDLWGQGDFPFYFVQIAPYKYDNKVNSAFLREAQLKTMHNTPNTGMAVTMDVGEYACIHPAEKFIVGERLAYWALAKDYGVKGIQYSGPVYKSMEVKGKEIKLNFDYADTGLCCYGKTFDTFTIAAEDKVFHQAKAEVRRDGLYVWCDEVENPVAVRYGFENFVMGDFTNAAGLTASSFRTDDWDE